jgi:hypothetical protein
VRDSFWLVWSPKGYRPPSFRHPTYSAAETEARRLAEQNPGSAFFVMKAESVSAKQTVTTHRFPMDDDIPF